MDAEDREVELAREVTSRAIRRLNALEYLILFATVCLALLGGALVAWGVSASTGFSFRVLWVGASLLLFIVPGGIVYLRELRNRGAYTTPHTRDQKKDLHG